MAKSIMIKVIPIFGSVILFLAWVFQQTLLGDANSELQRIYSAHSAFQTYQSNNALFNAIQETVKNSTGSEEQVRRVALYNYELGLRELEGLLDKEARTDIPSAPNPYSGAPDIGTMMDITQDRLEKIQGKLAAKRDKIAHRKATLNAMFLMLYAVGSGTILIGSILNALISFKASEAEARAGKS
jgi:hypothetical protein